MIYTKAIPYTTIMIISKQNIHDVEKVGKKFVRISSIPL